MPLQVMPEYIPCQLVDSTVFAPRRVVTVAEVGSPSDVVFHPATGDLYFISSINHVIKRLSNKTGEVSWLEALLFGLAEYVLARTEQV